MKELDNLLLESEINSCEKLLNSCLSACNEVLTEDVRDMSNVSGSIVDYFDEAIKRLEAAKRGLGIVNRLPQGEQRTENRRRIMSNLNYIRNMVNKIIKDTESQDFSLKNRMEQQGRQNQLPHPQGRQVQPPQNQQRQAPPVQR